MSSVSPRIRDKFESLPIDLKNEILSRNVRLNNLNDLMSVLQTIVDEGDSQ
jgi:hypothetical protein